MSIFPSTLIIASSSQAAYNQAIVLLSTLDHKDLNNPDLSIVNDYSISSIRALTKFLSQKPFNHQNKVVLIPKAEELNQESQNALLKTLEEPGKDNYLILTTTNITKLLPTIISRCQKVKLNQTPVKETTKPWLKTGNIKKDLEFASTITNDKNEIKSLLEAQLAAYQQLLKKSPKGDTADVIKKLIASIDLINCNVDPKNALDYFFLK